ncbi:MAG: thiolase family protein, partial [Chloroflexi bacterium]|nr:thiolase family protein [Chloroflexota bacterium]
MRDVAVIGVGMTRFAKMPEADVIDLGIQACLDAIKDAGIDPRAIQTAYCGHARTGQLLGREGGVGQTILYQIGVSGIPMVDVSNFCASGSTAFREAWLAVASGLYDVAIAIGVEQLTARSGKGQPLTSDNVKYLTAMGFSPPTFFAQIARRHMYEYGT